MQGHDIHTVPKDGYESISTICLDFPELRGGLGPDGSMRDKFMVLAAVYVPLDGMNEKDLCVADLMVNDGGSGVHRFVSSGPEQLR